MKIQICTNTNDNTITIQITLGKFKTKQDKKGMVLEISFWPKIQIQLLVQLQARKRLTENISNTNKNMNTDK